MVTFAVLHGPSKPMPRLLCTKHIRVSRQQRRLRCNLRHLPPGSQAGLSWGSFRHDLRGCVRGQKRAAAKAARLVPSDPNICEGTSDLLHPFADCQHEQVTVLMSSNLGDSKRIHLGKQRHVMGRDEVAWVCVTAWRAWTCSLGTSPCGRNLLHPVLFILEEG